jgi:hypothetical protein
LSIGQSTGSFYRTKSAVFEALAKIGKVQQLSCLPQVLERFFSAAFTLVPVPDSSSRTPKFSFCDSFATCTSLIAILDTYSRIPGAQTESEKLIEAVESDIKGLSRYLSPTLWRAIWFKVQSIKVQSEMRAQINALRDPSGVLYRSMERKVADSLKTKFAKLHDFAVRELGVAIAKVKGADLADPSQAQQFAQDILGAENTNLLLAKGPDSAEVLEYFAQESLSILQSALLMDSVNAGMNRYLLRLQDLNMQGAFLDQMLVEAANSGPHVGGAEEEISTESSLLMLSEFAEIEAMLPYRIFWRQATQKIFALLPASSQSGFFKGLESSILAKLDGAVQFMNSIAGSENFSATDAMFSKIQEGSEQLSGQPGWAEVQGKIKATVAAEQAMAKNLVRHEADFPERFANFSSLMSEFTEFNKSLVSLNTYYGVIQESLERDSMSEEQRRAAVLEVESYRGRVLEHWLNLRCLDGLTRDKGLIGSTFPVVPSLKIHFDCGELTDGEVLLDYARIRKRTSEYAATLRWNASLSQLRQDQFLVASTIAMYGVGSLGGIIGTGITKFSGALLRQFVLSRVKASLQAKIINSIVSRSINFAFSISVNVVVFEKLMHPVEGLIRKEMKMANPETSEAGMEMIGFLQGFAMFSATHFVTPVASRLALLATRGSQKLAASLGPGSLLGSQLLNGTRSVAPKVNLMQFYEFGFGLAAETGIFFALPIATRKVIEEFHPAPEQSAVEKSLLSLYEPTTGAQLSTSFESASIFRIVGIIHGRVLR